MFASIDGANPEYMALAPHILTRCHVSPPSILGNIFGNHSTSLAGWASSAEALNRMDGGFTEWMAKSPSTLR